MINWRRFILPYNKNITLSGPRPLSPKKKDGDFDFIEGGPESEENRFIDPVRDSESDVFLHSLQYITPDDMAPPAPKKKKPLSELIVAGVRKALFFASIGVFAVSAASIVNTLYNYKRGDDIYAAIASDFYGESSETGQIADGGSSPALAKSSATPDFKTSLLSSSSGASSASSASGGKINVAFEELKAKLNNLKTKNPDLYGWITIKDTNIDYPVVQGGDNDYYLTHAFNGDYLPAGSVFVDYRCSDSIMRNHNTVVYGHNMTNGLMFNNITKFLDQKFFDEHPYITVSTLDGIYTYEVFAIYQTDMYYSYIKTDFASHAEFVEFANEMKSNSLYEREGITFEETDRIITLSTCTNGYYANRYCLQAKLIKTES